MSYKMSGRCFTVWSLATITLVFCAVLVRMIYELTPPPVPALGTIVIVVLLMLVSFSLYALSFYLIINPSLKKLRSSFIRVGFAVIITAALISGIIHFIRFIPSPEAGSIYSVIIATLSLTAGISGYLLALWFLWSNRNNKSS